MNHHQANELLPCPFCGAPAQEKRNRTVMVACTKCTAATFQELADPSTAIAAWNRRAAPTEPAVDRVAVLEEAAAVCDAKFNARVASGHPREASAARSCRDEIRSLKLSAPATPAVPVAPLVASEVADALFHLTELASFAYQHGFHELGYNPVQTVRAAIDTSRRNNSSPSVDQAKRLVAAPTTGHKGAIMLTLPTQQPTQQELAAQMESATKIAAGLSGFVAGTIVGISAEFLTAASKEIISLIALIDAQQKKIAEQDAQLQAAYP